MPNENTKRKKNLLKKIKNVLCYLMVGAADVGEVAIATKRNPIYK